MGYYRDKIIHSDSGTFTLDGSGWFYITTASTKESYFSYSFGGYAGLRDSFYYYGSEDLTFKFYMDGSHVHTLVRSPSDRNETSYRLFMEYGARLRVEVTVPEYVSTPPSPPSSITVSPSQVKDGESISISWGSGSGASSYRLERSANGGSYTQIYSGSNRSYVDTSLKSWDTVTYRVRSYNVDGYSSYRTSDTIIVTHFPEMGLKVDGTLKISEMGWVKIDGALREIDSIYTKIDGILKEVE